MSRLARLAFLLVASAVASAPFPLRAQIARPTNAGQSAGNNASPTSTTTFATPNFSQPVQTSLVDGLNVASDGSLEASPELQQELDELLDQQINNLDQAGNFRFGAAGPLLAAVGDEPMNTAALRSGSVAVRDNLLQVSIGGEHVDLPTKPVNQAALRRFAEQAIQAVFTPASLSLGAQLVGLGTPVQATLELMGSLQGLATQPNLDVLARGIAFLTRS